MGNDKTDFYSYQKINNNFGVYTVTLKKEKTSKNEMLNIDLKSAPDIAQTIAVTCFALGIGCDLTGLHTLKIKETDRLVALQNELEKFGAAIQVTKDSLHLEAGDQFRSGVEVETYHDHRMAMAFAPLALKVPLTIKDAEVVTKSYISFWQHLDAVIQ